MSQLFHEPDFLLHQILHAVKRLEQKLGYCQEERCTIYWERERKYLFPGGFFVLDHRGKVPSIQILSVWTRKKCAD